MFGHFTYLTFELAWALPVLAVHWLLDRRRLRARLRLLVMVTVATTVYLTVADGVAIRAHIWMLHPDRLLGLSIGNVPIEESVFFLVTNLVVVQSLILLGPRDLQDASFARHTSTATDTRSVPRTRAYETCPQSQVRVDPIPENRA